MNVDPPGGGPYQARTTGHPAVHVDGDVTIVPVVGGHDLHLPAAWTDAVDQVGLGYFALPDDRIVVPAGDLAAAQQMLQRIRYHLHHHPGKGPA